MKIPIKYATESGAWFKCETAMFGEPYIFKIRILSFDKVASKVMRELQKEIRFDEGILWLMRIEVVNLNKIPFSGWLVQDKIILFDQDDFKFNTTYVSQLAATEFGEREGMKRFSGWSSIPYLTPKIKAVGALSFLLPDEDESEYYFSVDGNIHEV